MFLSRTLQSEAVSVEVLVAELAPESVHEVPKELFGRDFLVEEVLELGLEVIDGMVLEYLREVLVELLVLVVGLLVHQVELHLLHTHTVSLFALVFPLVVFLDDFLFFLESRYLLLDEVREEFHHVVAGVVLGNHFGLVVNVHESLLFL